MGRYGPTHLGRASAPRKAGFEHVLTLRPEATQGVASCRPGGACGDRQKIQQQEREDEQFPLGGAPEWAMGGAAKPVVVGGDVDAGGQGSEHEAKEHGHTESREPAGVCASADHEYPHDERDRRDGRTLGGVTEQRAVWRRRHGPFGDWRIVELGWHGISQCSKTYLGYVLHHVVAAMGYGP